jgi:outer membrane biosynthesis protein TonB
LNRLSLLGYNCGARLVEVARIIGTDGSIQALQVISGDPLFYQSALHAVQQWYTPTLLNDQAVEVDTQIW